MDSDSDSDDERGVPAWWLEDTSDEDEDEAEAPGEFRCPLTLSMMGSPVTLKTSANTNYERAALEVWLSRRPRRDPMTNADASAQLEFEKNEGLAKRIQQWRIERGLPPMKKRKITERAPSVVGQIERYVLALHRDPASAALGIARLCSDNERARVETRQRGGIDALIKILRRETDQGLIGGVRAAFTQEDRGIDAQTACALALAALARNGDNRYVIARGGGIRPLTKLCASWDLAGQEAGALALAQMAKTYKVWVSVSAEPLVDLLSNDSATPNAKLSAARALWAIAGGGADEIKRHLLEANALPIFAHLLGLRTAKKFSVDIEPKLVQVSGWALQGLAASHDKRIRAIVARQLGFRFLVRPPTFPVIRRRITSIVDKRLASLRDES